MNRTQARQLVTETFTHAFDKARFRNFILNLLNHLDESKAQQWNTAYVKDAFKADVHRYERLGTYTSPDKETLDVLVVHLTAESKLERARTSIRNFVADHLKTRDEKDAALVAFVSPSESTWRFSYVKMEYATIAKESGKVGIETKLTPARRFSYIVGEGESCHTAQARFLNLLGGTEADPLLASIEEAFSVEAVTKEFFTKYAELFLQINSALEDLAAKDKAIRNEFASKNVKTVDFAKKLMGQIVFLYFLQKKGWLGVAKGKDWGTGPHDFLRRMANGGFGKYGNFFNDILEPLFYDTLATDRGHEALCDRFECRIPFLNGGLFEPLGDYNWSTIDVHLPNRLFTNADYVDEGVTGTGVLDVFDRYNFTVNEAEPLEKEVAIDPEMLGKVFENLIEENRRKGLGAYYTPREIVHYMCQESLINYLDAALNKENQLVPRVDIETFIHLGEQISHYEAVEAKYVIKMPKSVQQSARLLDEKLSDITVCDPAVGSGAFPVGMMTEIVRGRCALTPYFNDVHERTAYHFKRHAIQNCLYGVDIDAGAVEIAKLRLWLSLVVDEEDVKQIKPLPNLDFKIVAGDSLLGFPFKSKGLEEVEVLKQQLFDESDHDCKRALKRKIDKLLAECIENSKQSLGYKVTFDYATWFSEVFRKQGGFDVVIANPPYVDSETMVRADPIGRTRLSQLYATAKGNWDLYIPFWELALKRTCTSGTSALITPNKWLSISYGASLRSVAAPYIYRISDYSHFRAFENVGIFPVVVLMSKRRPPELTVSRYMDEQRLIFEYTMPVENVNKFDNWGVLLSQQLPLLLRITDHPKLSAHCLPAEPFTVSEAYNLVPLLKEWRSDQEGHFRFVNTGTIDPYVTLWGHKSTTYLKHKYSKPVISRDRFNELFPRRCKQSASTKIIISGIRHFECFLDLKGDYVAGKSTVVLLDLNDRVSPEFLIGVLNSALVKFFFKECYASLAMDGGINFTPTNVSEIPIAKPSAKIESSIVGYVREVLSAKERSPSAPIDQSRTNIDRLVFQLYGLTAAEMELVAESTRR